MAQQSDNTGYQGVGTDAGLDEEPRRWKLDKIPNWAGSQLGCRLSVNDKSRGLIMLNNEEEYEWLKDRVERP